MRFRVEQRFDAPPAAVEAALLDPGFLLRLAGLPKLGAPELLSTEVDGHLVHQRVRYRFAGDLAPAVTAVIDPERLTWVEETTYDLVVHCGEHRIIPDHHAGRLTSSYSTHLTPAGDDPDATVRTTDGEVKVRFALVGGKVEKAIVSGLISHAALEAEVVTGWLAEQG